MNILRTAVDYLLGGPRVGGEQEARVNRWRAVPQADLARRHNAARYVVVDIETTGPDMRSDRLIAIGAVGVAQGCLDLGDCFEQVLRQDKASADANVLIHGIGGETQLSGAEPGDAVIEFLEYLGKSPLVAFRAKFSQAILARSVRSILGYPFSHPWIDLASLLPELFPGTRHTSLDGWLAHFGLLDGTRRNTLTDAFVAAQLLQIALEAADRAGLANGAQLIATQRARQWLGSP